MYNDDRLYFYQIINDLVERTNVELVYIHKGQSEVWLQRKDQRHNQVIRLTQLGFDWRNQLEADYQRTMYNSEKLSRLFLGRNITLYNVYVSAYSPVDEWQHLKNPIKHRHRKFLEMKTFYLTKEDRKQEQTNLFAELNLSEPKIVKPDYSVNQEQVIYQQYVKMMRIYNNKQYEQKQMFQYAKPLFTYVILAINVFLFILLEIQGGSTSTDVLIRFGAKYNPAILDGEWWRIISSVFLHIGMLHLIMNMLALHVVGSLVEQIYGNMRFIIIYLLAGVVGGVTSFAYSPQVAAGASGAIFGLFGALLYFGLNHRRIFFQTMGWNVIGVILFNIGFGFMVPQIDNSAHIGGLFGGFVAAAIVYFPKKKQLLHQLLASFLFISITIMIIWFGSANHAVQQEANQYELARQVKVINDLIDQEAYEQIITVSTQALDIEPNDYRAELLFYRSYAYSYMSQTDKALKDLETLIRIAPNKIPEAHFNLALIYLDSNMLEKAKTALEKAIELRPDEKSFRQLYQERFGES